MDHYTLLERNLIHIAVTLWEKDGHHHWADQGSGNGGEEQEVEQEVDEVGGTDCCGGIQSAFICASKLSVVS